MNKTQTLESIQKAREAHEIQMRKIKSLIDGEKVKDPTSVAKTKCTFGKWLYNEENKVQQILGAHFYDKIEQTHAKWHIEYMRIFEIFFNNKKTGLLSKLLGSNKIDDMDIDRAKLYYMELEATTVELLKALRASERRIQALAPSKFQ